jgi:hypothetical protein
MLHVGRFSDAGAQAEKPGNVPTLSKSVGIIDGEHKIQGNEESHSGNLPKMIDLGHRFGNALEAFFQPFDFLGHRLELIE